MSTKTSRRLQAQPQRGFIMLALLLIMVIGGSSLVLAGLNNRQSTYLKQQEELRQQMELAKQTLLAYATNSASLFYSDRGPGYLPCPDTTTTDSDNDGVVIDSWNTTCSSTIGRLPEAVTVGGTNFPLNDYYDDLDQQFWYVVGPRYTNTSSNNYSSTRQSYRRTSTVATDTSAYNFQLKLDDSATPRYVALIIAPGEALGSQDRSLSQTLYSNYLDGQNGDTSYDFYTSDSSNPELFNDLIIGITVDEYVRAVGPVVAREIKRGLDAYSTDYPTSPGYDATELQGTIPTSTEQSSFRNIFNFDSTVASILPIWLKRNSTSYPNTNGERWPNYIYYANDSTVQGRFVFRGCTGIQFTIHRTSGISREGSAC